MFFAETCPVTAWKGLRCVQQATELHAGLGADSSFGGGEETGFSTGVSWSVSQGRMKACQCASWVVTISFMCTSADM